MLNHSRLSEQFLLLIVEPVFPIEQYYVIPYGEAVLNVGFRSGSAAVKVEAFPSRMFSVHVYSHVLPLYFLIVCNLSLNGSSYSLIF
jgi:hypothetical protein